MSDLPLGLRLHNPLNIKRATAMGAKVDTAWRGAMPIQGHKTFVSFIHPIYGIRAAARIMHRYREQGTVAIDRVINRWAPPTADDNPTHNYVEAVAGWLGMDARYSWEQVGLHRLLPAMARFEQGIECPWPEIFWEDGVRLAERKG